MSRKKQMKAKLPSQREAVLLQILVSGEKYGLELRSAYVERTKSSMPLGSLYVTLQRMEDKGFIESRTGESSHERGGNRRKFFKITGEGASALNAYVQHSTRVFGGIIQAFVGIGGAQ